MTQATIDWLNNLDHAAAVDVFTRCCGARGWCEAVAHSRPFADPPGLSDASAAAFDALTRDDWLEAFASHPRIGDFESLKMRYAGNREWSAGEQAGAAAADDRVLRRLADGNAAYERRFGHLFIVCATGKSAAEMLALLEARMGNDPEAELRIAAAEQSKITALRLAKLEPTEGNAGPMSPITTHVLDTSLGQPAEGVVVTLARLGDDDAAIDLRHGVTDGDGRITTLLGPGPVEPGVYRLTFETTAYFASTRRESFYPRVEIAFHVVEGSEHYHVPLLLSPFGYSTYRGS